MGRWLYTIGEVLCVGEEFLVALLYLVDVMYVTRGSDALFGNGLAGGRLGICVDVSFCRGGLGIPKRRIFKRVPNCFKSELSDEG